VFKSYLLGIILNPVDLVHIPPPLLYRDYAFLPIQGSFTNIESPDNEGRFL